MVTVIDEAMEAEGRRVEEELRWQTEADVRALVEARRIMNDEDRLQRAIEFLEQGMEQAKS